MSNLDWFVLVSTLVFIVAYGVWQTRGKKDTKSYLVGSGDLKWWTIGLSIMATQASAVTFLSTPGKAFDDGMRFGQFYFGLPLAMIIIAVFILPIFYKLKVYTAYEYLETRFDLRTRVFTAILFLLSRGMATGLVIFAPAIVLSTILGWSLGNTMFIMGLLVITYTVAGGSDAVSKTQQQQMIIILLGMFAAFLVLVFSLPQDISFMETVQVADKMDKLNIVSFEFDLNDKYNIWSALFGGTFLFLSYFGTDQSQVQRYLSGRTLRESRLGLLFNALFKVPMQLMILFVGVMVFMFYQFYQPPVFFNKGAKLAVMQSEYASELTDLEKTQTAVFTQKKDAIYSLVSAINSKDETAIQNQQAQLLNLQTQTDTIRAKAGRIAKKAGQEKNDSDYVFITFIMTHLPKGLVGLLLAVIFAAAMSTTAAELNALATATTIDIYKRVLVQGKEDSHYLKASKLFTVLWGIIALSFATFASLFDNLIEAVNIVGSLFYGVILGIFMVGFFFKKIGAKAVFGAALMAEVIVIFVFTQDWMAYLWLNMLGCVVLILIAMLFQVLLPIFSRYSKVINEL